LGRISQLNCDLDLLWVDWDICKETKEKKNQLAFLRDAKLVLDSLQESQFDFTMESTGKTSCCRVRMEVKVEWHRSSV